MFASPQPVKRTPNDSYRPSTPPPIVVRIVPNPDAPQKDVIQNSITPSGQPQDLMTRSGGWTMLPPSTQEQATEENKQKPIDSCKKPAALLYPPKVEEEQKPRDWVKIAGMVVFVIAAIFLALSVLCIMGFFPLDLLRGSTGVAFTITASAVIMTVSGCVVYYRWQFPPTPEPVPEKKSLKQLSST